MNTPTLVVLNHGSSSLKFGLYRAYADEPDLLVTGDLHAADAPQAMRQISQLCEHPIAVGHRVVHSGPNLHLHCRLDEQVLAHIVAAAAFAPLHTPATVALIHAAQAQFPLALQVACFDTSFHAGLPELARVLPLPVALRAEGIRRYGFHGLSCASILRQLGGGLPDRLIIAHLGHGASITAVKNGVSIDTSMGMTPSGGVLMGTRSGELDPGVLLYLMRERGMDADALDTLINQRSGLLGISGISSDLRKLHEVSGEHAGARLAIEMFCYAVRKQIAAMMAVLGGVDLLVFTGGAGENNARIRAAICIGLAWAGLHLDEALNAASQPLISTADSVFRVQVMPSREADEIARHTADLLNAGRSVSGTPLPHRSAS